MSNLEISNKSNMKYQYHSTNTLKDKSSQNKSLLKFIIIKPHANIIGHPVSFIVLSWFKTEKRKKGKRSINPTKQQTRLHYNFTKHICYSIWNIEAQKLSFSLKIAGTRVEIERTSHPRLSTNLQVRWRSAPPWFFVERRWSITEQREADAKKEKKRNENEKSIW